MRILLVSDTDLKREFGASKVLIELAEELERLGWQCRLSSLPELVGDRKGKGDARPEALRSYLREHAGEYDVVDYGHSHLPYPRSEFAATTLFVARSVLLTHHFTQLKVPSYGTWKARAHQLAYGMRDRLRLLRYLRRTDVTLAEADLVNVSNDHDQRALMRVGLPKDKIVVLPYGLTRSLAELFGELSPSVPANPVVAFVGTFDARKGASDLPRIVQRVVDDVPGARFKLLGTYKDDTEVLARFPKRLRESIEVVPSFSPERLPELLAPCSLGLFPSYIEGFGFGVLEMLAAGLPVIAYDAPGPPMMLPSDWLVRAGDTPAMSGKIVNLLRSRPDLERGRAWARQRSRQFTWSDIARSTGEIYLARWEEHRRANAAS